MLINIPYIEHLGIFMFMVNVGKYTIPIQYLGIELDKTSSQPMKFGEVSFE